MTSSPEVLFQHPLVVLGTTPGSARTYASGLHTAPQPLFKTRHFSGSAFRFVSPDTQTQYLASRMRDGQLE